jgi:RNA polymerase sigma factor (sigma-70 family)
VPDLGANPLEALEEQDLARRLEDLLAALPENQRRALVLKRFGDLSYQEIGAEMDLSPQAVDGLLKRARQFLKKALQEVFLKAYEHAGRFQPISTVKAWLNRITANHCLNRLRERVPQDSLDDEEKSPQLPSLTADPLEALEESELARRLERLLAALPENQRRALVLKRFGDLSYQEIGEEMGLSAQAVDGLLKRARQTLKKALEEYLE